MTPSLSKNDNMETANENLELPSTKCENLPHSV